MKRNIPTVHSEGKSSRQAHADLPAGTVEREIGREGFFGPTTHMYHPRPPTGWSKVDGPLKPRAFDTSLVSVNAPSPMDAMLLLSNAHLQYRYWHCHSSMDQLFRNGDGDDLLFLHSGRAEFYCDYGHLSLRDGDYLLIPRGTMWRIELKKSITALLIEATNTFYRLPEKGLLGAHAIFDPAMLDRPVIDEAFESQKSNEPWSLVIKRRGQKTVVAYPYNPLDAMGWHGDLSPVRLNWRDIRPIMSHRYHLPPSVHTTFLTDRFVVCTFVPRPFETDPGAIKVPFFHNNEDFDEVIFYHAGEFFSRDHINAGAITLHPAGFTHGPHPRALTNMLQQKQPGTNEVAVMVDARDSLDISASARAIEMPDYVASWGSEPLNIKGSDPDR